MEKSFQELAAVKPLFLFAWSLVNFLARLPRWTLAFFQAVPVALRIRRKDRLREAIRLDRIRHPERYRSKN